MPTYTIIFTATIDGKLRTKKTDVKAKDMIRAVEELRRQFRQVEEIWSIEVKK